MNPRAWLTAGLLALGLLAPPVAEAQEWHQLYADGERALRGNQPQRAADLLRRAIQRRPQPGVAVPTYGTNFEPRYFPYLRLAEAYRRLGAYEDALTALETSARLGVEPASERSALEARVRAAVDAKRPPPSQPSLPPPASTPGPEIAAPTATGPVTPTAGESAVPPTEASRSPSPPSAVAPSPAEPVDPPPTPAPPPAPASSAASPRPAEPARRGPALDITSAPPGAQVFVDDERIGRTDPETGRLRITALRPGRHRVRLSSEGHNDLTREVDIGSESVAFHGALSSRTEPTEPSTVEAPATPLTDPQSSQPSLPRWLVFGLGIAVVLALSLWLKSLSSLPRTPERAHTSPHPVSIKADTTDEGLPIEFGDYRLIRRIGKGGMASVYEAERRGERFALKRPLAGFLDDRTFLERFLREADLGRTLHHPNIVRIFDRGQVGSTPYFAMELIAGETLRARLDRDGRLDPTLATRITAQVAEALDYAHHKGVIHRDLKPSNVMLERSGGVKVMDYGIARSAHLEGVTITGRFVGTPHYAAPETVEGKTEPRSDIYALGVVFFEMLTGSLPFRGGSVLEVLQSHCVTPPPLPSSLNYTLSKELDRIVLRLLSKEPSARPTAEELLNELSDHLRRADEDV